MKKNGKIKAISFDGDMTLWDFQKVMRHSLALVLAEIRRRAPGRRTDELTIDTLIQIRNAVAGELRGMIVNLEEVRLRAFQRTVEVVGSSDDTLAYDLNALYLKHRFEDIELYADVVPCLAALGPDYELGLLSNGNGYPDRCGLAGRFSFIVFSQDVGAEKPDAVMFHAACKLAGCSPSELIHVGDSLEEDVAGANGVGAVSVWLNRDATQNNTGIVAEYEVSSLTALVDIVANSAATSNNDMQPAGSARG